MEVYQAFVYISRKIKSVETIFACLSHVRHPRKKTETEPSVPITEEGDVGRSTCPVHN